MKKSVKLLLSFLLPITLTACFLIASVLIVDPYFHYHKQLKNISYRTDFLSERYCNDGIIKNFDYDAVITGTSMTQNFSVSLASDIFDMEFVKVPLAGGSYKEIDYYVNEASNRKTTKLVIRGLDQGRFADDVDLMRYDLGEYPTYLYDNNFLNDFKYLFNGDVIFKKCLPQLIKTLFSKDNKEKINFDEYSSFMSYSTFGKNEFLEGEIINPKNRDSKTQLPSETKEKILANFEANVFKTVKEHPNTEFYYFFTPYSALNWHSKVTGGLLKAELEKQKLILEESFNYKNLKMFSFDNCFEITTNLNFYKDYYHYGSWVNDFILKAMKKNEYLVTKDNLENYIDEVENFYKTFDFETLNSQIDYEDDNLVINDVPSI